MGTMTKGCNVTAHRFTAGRLAQMMEISMFDGQGYNEVLVDTDVYMKNLPKSCARRGSSSPGRIGPHTCTCITPHTKYHSRVLAPLLGGAVAAFVIGLREGSSASEPLSDTPLPASLYLRFLACYNLTESDVPLLRVDYVVPFDPYAPDDVTQDSTKMVFKDVSHEARKLAQLERLQKKSRKHKPKPIWKPGQDYRRGAHRGPPIGPTEG